MDLKRAIMELSAIRGVSGGEGEISRAAAERMRPFVDSVRVDRFGNVVGYMRSAETGAPTLMLDAHIDQVGLMIADVTDDGFAHFVPIGVDPRTLLSNEMIVLGRGGPIKGVISALPPHLQNEGDDLKPVPVGEMTLDLGMTGARARELVRPGDLVAFDADPVELLGNNIAGPSMDNRAGFACVVRALELLANTNPPCNLVVTATTREESGYYGAVQCATEERPDYILVVDACHARTGDAERYARVHEPGSGPVVGRGANSSPRVAEHLIDAAERGGLPYQLEAIPKTSNTNAWLAQIAGVGATTAVISLPVKYMHTPVETLCVDDAETLARLLYAFCRDFKGLRVRGGEAA
ncbi:M20/M25/M40 family metallo-hydrolase [Synergistaceae bacterium OttesenSCG-928-I11]|nr:M20/M25/M40 family metallo-hydrolase [Synergistaceae bacterium OttesenSCG-928-I11]